MQVRLPLLKPPAELVPQGSEAGPLLQVGDLARECGKTVRAIHLYEQLELLRPAAMANLLGDVWSNGEPNWAAAAAIPNVKIHLYGKMEARPGRKMGHLTALASTAEEAAATVLAARDAL